MIQTKNNSQENSIEQEDSDEEAPPPPPPPPPKPSTDPIWKARLKRIYLRNIRVLGGANLLYRWYRKRQRQRMIMM